MTRPTRTGPPGRGRMLIGPLRVAAGAGFAFALAGAVAPRPAGSILGGLMIAVLVGVPLLRVVFFAGRWWQLADRRYALFAAVLSTEILAGAVIASV